MKVQMQKWLGCGLGLGLGWLVGGCVALEGSQEPPPATQADVQYLREELRRMNDRLQASEMQVGDVQRNWMSAESSRPATASAAEVAALRDQLSALQRQVQALDAAREKDKREIYDDISKKVASLIKTATPAAAASRSKSTGSQTGYEHVVQPGESLSQIAKAYGVKMSVIVSENSLKSADTIRVGQKLFIPD